MNNANSTERAEAMGREIAAESRPNLFEDEVRSLLVKRLGKLTGAEKNAGWEAYAAVRFPVAS